MTCAARFPSRLGHLAQCAGNFAGQTHPQSSFETPTWNPKTQNPGCGALGSGGCGAGAALGMGGDCSCWEAGCRSLAGPLARPAAAHGEQTCLSVIFAKSAVWLCSGAPERGKSAAVGDPSSRWAGPPPPSVRAISVEQTFRDPPLKGRFWGWCFLWGVLRPSGRCFACVRACRVCVRACERGVRACVRACARDVRA